MPAYALLALAIVCEVVATTAMKSADGFTKLGPSLIVVVGYAVAFFLLAQILDRIPLGIAYAVWAGGGIVLVALLGSVVYGQRPDAAGFARHRLDRVWRPSPEPAVEEQPALNAKRRAPRTCRKTTGGSYRIARCRCRGLRLKAKNIAQLTPSRPRTSPEPRGFFSS
jgi:multidrug transporter EmrE-like cation transporter